MSKTSQNLDNHRAKRVPWSTFRHDRHVGITPFVISPRQQGVFTGVIDIDPWRRSDRSRRTSRDEESRSTEVFAVVRSVETHGVGEFARAIRQGLAMCFDTTTSAHEVEAMQGFDRAHKDRMWMSFSSNDDVEGPVHSVEQKHVGSSGRTEHRFGSLRTSTSGAVCRAIFRASIRFTLDDPTCRRSFGRTMHEDGSDELGGDVEDFAIVEGAR